MTQITPYFIESIGKIVAMEKKLSANVGSVEVLKEAKVMGFGDKFIAQLWQWKELEVYAMRCKENLFPAFRMVDTCHTGGLYPLLLLLLYRHH